MLKLFKRSSKLVNNHSGSDSGDGSCSIVNPVHGRELLTRYVGKGKTEEGLHEIFEKSNVGKYCRIIIQDNCLIVSELTDAEIMRISGDRIVRCVQDSSHDKLCNCVVVMVGQDDRSIHLFETCSVKEAGELATWIKDLIQVSSVKQLLTEKSVQPSINVTTKLSDPRKSSKTIATGKSKGILHPLSKVNKIGRKGVARSKDVTISNKTRQQKIEAVVHSVEMLTRDNNRLRLVCSNAPMGEDCDPFWVALRSLTSHDCSQLIECFKRPGINVESCDPDGNTLLHYATVLGRKDMMRLLYRRGANLDSTCRGMVRPLHRAAACGDAGIIQALLAMGTAPNEVDVNKRSPLHICASSVRYLECMHILVEHGAKIRLADCNGIRPIDLHEDLRLIQNQLITSACERFADAPLKVSRSATICSGDSSVTTHTSSTAPASLVPLTVVTDNECYHWEGGQIVNELLDQVVAHTANSMVNGESKHCQRSQSFGNLHQLSECEEEKLSLLNLKYPSAYSLNVKGLVEESADNVEKTLKDLISAASKVNAGQPRLIRRTIIDHDELPDTDCLVTVSPPPSPVHIPPVDSKTSLNAVSSSTLINTDSSSSSKSTQNFQDILSIQETSSTHMLHRAFSNLEHQLYQERKEALKRPQSVNKDAKRNLAKDYIKDFRNSIGLPAVHNVHTRTKQETNCLFEEILHELEDNLCNEPSSEGNHTVNLASYDTITSHDASTSHDATSHDPPAHDVIATPHLTCDPIASHDHAGSHETVLVTTHASLSTDPDCLDHCRRSSMGTVTLPYDMGEDEPGAIALKQLVIISSNEECLGRIVGHVCLPVFSSKLIQLSQWQCSSAGLLSNMAALLYNLFEVGNSEDRKKALDSGLLSLVVKLLQSRHPLPGTCLALLGGLLISEDNEDYLPIIIKIPISPLLKFLEPLENDSGFRGTSTCSSSERRHSSFNDPKLVRPSKLNSDTQHETTDTLSCAASFTSEVVSEGSSRSAVGPSLTGQLITHLEARSIALKLLALSSTHVKVIAELCNENALALLMDVLTDQSQGDIVNALTTLANVASHSASHLMLGQLRVSDKIKTLAQSGPSLRYQVIRLLVYTGELGNDQHYGSLFTDNDCGYAGEDVLLEYGDPPFVKGASIEQLVQILTSNYLLLWGGVELTNKEKWMIALGISSEEQLLEQIVMDFFLITYHSFVEPIILLRLLLHRIRTATGEHNILPNKAINSVESSGIMILARWIRTFPDDFQLQPVINDEVNALITQLRNCRGPRLLHAHKLKNLLYDIKYHHNRHGNQGLQTVATRIAHHDHLYSLCQQMILSDHLPSTNEQAVMLAALQLHIENITMQAPFYVINSSKTKQAKPLNNSGIKLALPVHTHSKIRQLSKRVKAQLKKLSELSERNAKHAYIEYCMGMPGYGAMFYEIRVMNSINTKRSVNVTHLMGINEVEIILLDSDSRNVSSRYLIEGIMGIYHEPGNCLITLVFKETTLQFVTHTPSVAMGIYNTLEQYQDNNDWIKLCNENFEPSDDSSWNRYSEVNGESSDMSTSSHSSSDVHPLEHSLPSGISSHDLCHHQESGVHVKTSSFCNCPPDPQIPKHLDFTHMNFKQLLAYPVELARQITLLDHELLCNITMREMLQKASMDRHYLDTSYVSGTGIEQLAAQFNKLGSFVTQCIIQEQSPDVRVNVIKALILVAKNCFELKNFNAVMAIAVLGLQSVPVRNLKSSWEVMPTIYMDFLREMLIVMDSRANYSNYRDILKNTIPPSVPYLGVFLKDLNSINEGNSDYTRSGLVNMNKRRQMYIKLMEMKMMQSIKYNFVPLETVQDILKQLNCSDNLTEVG